jgi:hypothetical protein
VSVVLGIRDGKVPGEVKKRADGIVEVRGNGKWFLMSEARYLEILG